MDSTRWGESHTGQQGPMTPGTGPYQPFPDPGVVDPDNPFDEPETAPELRQARSDSLYSRSTPFWESVDEKPVESGYPRDAEYWNHPEELCEELSAADKALRPLTSLWNGLTSRTGRFFVGIVAVIAVVVFFGLSVFATVRTINVEGNVVFTDEEIIALSGLEPGMSTLRIDEESVMNRIAWQQRYLRCTLVDVSYDTVTIHVRERKPVACIAHNGQMIVMDNRGWVLEIYDDSDARGFISVSGLEVTERDKGQTVTLRKPQRLKIYTQILVELLAKGGLGMVRELDMSTMDSITLKTADGLTILLGNENNIGEKIRAMMVVYEKLYQNGFYGVGEGGTIVVSNPAKPAYTPAG